LIEIVGWIGSICFILAYGLVAQGKLDGKGKTFNWINLVGALLYTFYAIRKSAWPVVGLETCWGLIAIRALWNAYGH